MDQDPDPRHNRGHRASLRMLVLIGFVLLAALAIVILFTIGAGSQKGAPPHSIEAGAG
jgi:hypothetical protein